MDWLCSQSRCGALDTFEDAVRHVCREAVRQLRAHLGERFGRSRHEVVEHRLSRAPISRDDAVSRAELQPVPAQAASGAAVEASKLDQPEAERRQV